MKKFIDFIVSPKKKALFKRLLFLFMLFSFFSALVPAVHAIGTAGVLSGKVADKDTGKLIENVFVTAKSPSDTITSKTDKNGFFSMAGVPAGTYTVTLQHAAYETAEYTGVIITGDASTSLDFTISVRPVEVSGVIVTAQRAPLVNPHQVFTNYGYTNQDIDTNLPGAQSMGISALGNSNTITAIYETLPGVGISFDAYYGSGAPHIRGGTGSDILYAFDGVPTYETVTNTFGTNLTNVGTARTDFYTGGYPAQYGNFTSGFVNQVVKRGSGDLHGSLQVQYGFWMDPGSNLPTYNPITGTNPTYNGAQAYNPANFNLELEGKDRRLSYYFNHVVQNFGYVPYSTGVDVKPIIFDNGEQTYSDQLRDTVVNLNYDLNDHNDLQFLYYTGINNIYMSGFQELPCNPNDAFIGGTCLGSSSATGFGETYNANTIAPLQDGSQIQRYDLEKAELTHRFDSPGAVLNIRAWRYAPTVTFNIFTPPSSFFEYRQSIAKGALAEYQNQITSTQLVDLGGSYVYSNNSLISAPGTYNVFAAGNQINYPGTGLGVLGAHPVAVPDTQTIGVWLSDEWRPTEKLEFYGGLRYDRQNYVLIPGINGLPQANNVPGFGNGTVIPTGISQPNYITPRVGGSYKLSDKLTVKASYGKFDNFAPARDVEVINSSGNAVWSAGSLTQYGESTDVSFEYQFDNNTFGKITPYIKHITNPLQSNTVNGIPEFTNAGTIESKGIELYFKTRDWHNLSGWLSYTYSFTNGSQLPNESTLAASAQGAAGFTTAQVLADATQVVPTAYDQRHLLSVVMNYKVGSKWDISPNFTYGSGYAYGLGSQNLIALAALQDPSSTLYGGANTPATSAKNILGFNPLNESGFNGLRTPGWFLGNLAVTYHFNDNFDAIFNVLNIFNSNQVLQYDNTSFSGIGYSELTNPNAGPCCYTSQDTTKNITPQYNPTQGSYAPIGYPNLRQYYATLRFKF